MKINKVIGIDLGTTNSLASIMDLNDKEILTYEDVYGWRLVPSVVAYQPKTKMQAEKIMTGLPAFRRRGTAPEPIVSVKRYGWGNERKEVRQASYIM